MNLRHCHSGNANKEQYFTNHSQNQVLSMKASNLHAQLNKRSMYSRSMLIFRYRHTNMTIIERKEYVRTSANAW